METIIYLNVDEENIRIRGGYLNFTGREGDEEASKHSINLLAVQRYKFLNGTLTVYFMREEIERQVVERHTIGSEESTLINIDLEYDDDGDDGHEDEWKA